MILKVKSRTPAVFLAVPEGSRATLLSPRCLRSPGRAGEFSTLDRAPGPVGVQQDCCEPPWAGNLPSPLWPLPLGPQEALGPHLSEEALFTEVGRSDPPSHS